MALPTVQDLKDYLRIEFNTENALCGTLLARATAMLELWMDVPITARSTTATDRTGGEGVATALVFPGRPIASVVVTDADGATVAASDYVVDGAAGMIYGKDGYAFVRGPYTITASYGLSIRSDYASLEPLVSQLILDVAADLYQRRTPGASSETGAGTSITWDVSRETVARVMKSLRGLRLAVAV